MKSTMSEAQIRGLLAICVEENGDAVRIEPMEQPGPNKTWTPVGGPDSSKVVPLRVSVYGVPGGWTDGYWVRPTGRWCPPGSDVWREPAEAA